MIRRSLRVATSLAAALSILTPSADAALPMPGDPASGDSAVDQMTGSARLAVPIEVPPGAGGFSPQLVMAYASQGGDSPYGVGFSLALGPVPLGEVRVSTRFLPNGADIIYELDGEELVPSGTRYHTATAETFKRITREGAGATAGWLVELPDGTKARYGQDASSRFPTTGTPTRWLLSAITDKSGNTIRVSYADLNAGTPSVIAYSYQGHATNAPAIGGLREIRFVYETRPDPIFDFMGYEFRRITQRLREIRVLTGGSVFRRYSVLYRSNGAGQGRSLVSSVQAFGTDCTDLTKTPELGNCIGLPAQKLTYSSNNIPATPGSQIGPDVAAGVPVSTFFTETPNGPLIDAGVRPGDVNGDGLPDLVQAYRETNGAITQRVFLNTGDGWSSDTNNSWTVSLQSIQFQDKKQIDVCGTVVNAELQTALFVDRLPFVDNSFPNPVYRAPQSWKLVDLNDDGFADLITSYGLGVNICGNPQPPPTVRILEVWLNDRSGGWNRSSMSDNPLNYPVFGAVFPLGSLSAVSDFTDHRAVFGDFDGDGFTDVATITGIQRSPFSGFGPGAMLEPPRMPNGMPLTHHIFDLLEFTCDIGCNVIDIDTGGVYVDINRDGIEDFLKTASSLAAGASGCAADAVTGVWLGKRGGGFCSSIEGCPEAGRYLPPVPVNDNRTCASFVPRTVADTGLRFVDANGDGLIDLVQGRLEVGTSGTSSVRRAFIHDPSASSGSVWREDSRFAPSFDLTKIDLTVSSFPPSTPMSHQYLDINSDGADDVLYAGGKKLAQSTLPDLVASFDNGQGGVIGFAHETDVRQRVTAEPELMNRLEFFAAIAESILPGELGLPALPLYATPRWSKRPVVVAQTRQNMIEVGEPLATSEFTYARPGFSLENRTALGFQGVLIKKPDGSFSQVSFFQQRGVAGRMVGLLALDSSLNLLSEIRQVFAVKDGGTVPGSKLGVPVPRLVASKSRTHYLNDPLPSGEYTQVTSLAYDDTYGYNFVSSVTEQRNTSRLVRTATPTPASSFITPSLYVPGLPSRVEQRDGANRVLSRTDLGYDTLGRVTRMTSLIQARDNPVSPTNRVMEITYDVYGNVRSKSTGSVAGTPLVTEFICYDGDAALGMGTCPSPTGGLNSHSLVVGIRDALGKVTSIVPSPTTGLPERTVAFNGDVVEAVFDRFGRVTERAVDPIRGGVARTVLERREYNDIYIPGFFRPFVGTFVRTGNGTEEVRSVVLPDGFGRPDRMTEQTPSGSGFAGTVITRDPVARTVRETFVAACTDAFCRDIPANGFPATISTRDALGRVVQVEEWGDAQTRNSITLARFDRFTRSQPATFTPPGASTYFDSVLTKDANGNLTQRIVDGGRLVWSEECANTLGPTASSLTGVSCGSPDTSYFVYDATGEQTRLFDPIAFPNGPFNDANRYVGFAFDTLGRRISASDPDGGTTRSVFNVLSQKTQVTNARNQSTTFTYDLLGRTKTINRPGTEPDSTLTYDDELLAQGSRELARVLNTSAGLSPTQEDFQYDPFDNLSYRRASFTVSGTTTALVTRFQSDLLGRRTRIDYPDANTSVGYTYVGDVLTRVCELNGSGACTVDYVSSVEYDELGRESKAFGPIHTPAPTRTPHEITTYDPRTYRVAHQELATVQSLQGNTDARLNFDYQYDPLGNVTAIDDLNPTSVPGLAPFSDATYTYDSRNRLSSRTLGGVAKYFKYDRLGNLTGNLLNTAGAAANQVYSDTQRPHAIQTAGSTTFAYDADGNTTRRGTQFLGYNAANRLTCSGPSATTCTTVQIGYDAAGLRASEITSAGATFYVGDLFEYQRSPGVGTAHIFALGRQIAFKKIPTVTLRTDSPFGGTPFERLPQILVLALLTATGGLLIVVLLQSGAAQGWLRRPAYATSLFALAGVLAVPPQTWASAFPPPPSGVYRRWLTSDRVQSALYVFDEQGRRAHKRVFEPFGGVFAEVSSESTPREFGTHAFDSSLGLYYMKARFYDPNVGRFTSLDPVIRDPATIESVNPYSYVENNPVNRIDPTGAFFVGGGEGLPAGDCCGSSGGLGGFGLPPLPNANGTVSGTFGSVRVTVTTMISLPPTIFDRLPSGISSVKMAIPVFGGGVIVLDPSATRAANGVIFADGDQPEPGLESQDFLDPTDILAGVLVGAAVGGGVGVLLGVGFVVGRGVLRAGSKKLLKTLAKGAVTAGEEAGERATLTIARDVVLSGGRSGSKVARGLFGPPNSVVRGGGERIFVTDESGKVILDITRERVKEVLKDGGFGPKRAPTADEINLLKEVLGG